jgi:hypothetical protein
MSDGSEQNRMDSISLCLNTISRRALAHGFQAQPAASAVRLSDRRLILFALVVLPCAAALAGCQRGPEMYQVRGKIVYRGGVAPQGGVAVVQLVPKSETTAEVRKGASSGIGPNGELEFSTRIAGDGVYKGEYGVMFAHQRSVMDSTTLIPEKYRSPATSGYEVVVDKDIDDLVFEIEALPGAGRAAAAGRAVTR